MGLNWGKQGSISTANNSNNTKSALDDFLDYGNTIDNGQTRSSLWGGGSTGSAYQNTIKSALAKGDTLNDDARKQFMYDAAVQMAHGDTQKEQETDSDFAQRIDENYERLKDEADAQGMSYGEDTSGEDLRKQKQVGNNFFNNVVDVIGGAGRGLNKFNEDLGGFLDNITEGIPFIKEIDKSGWSMIPSLIEDALITGAGVALTPVTGGVSAAAIPALLAGKTAIEAAPTLEAAVTGVDRNTLQELDAGQRTLQAGAAALPVALSVLPGVGKIAKGGKGILDEAMSGVEKAIQGNAAKEAGEEAAQKVGSKIDSEISGATAGIDQRTGQFGKDKYAAESKYKQAQDETDAAIQEAENNLSTVKETNEEALKNAQDEADNLRAEDRLEQTKKGINQQEQKIANAEKKYDEARKLAEEYGIKESEALEMIKQVEAEGAKAEKIAEKELGATEKAGSKTLSKAEKQMKKELKDIENQYSKDIEKQKLERNELQSTKDQRVDDARTEAQQKVEQEFISNMDNPVPSAKEVLTPNGLGQAIKDTASNIAEGIRNVGPGRETRAAQEEGLKKTDELIAKRKMFQDTYGKSEKELTDSLTDAAKNKTETDDLLKIKQNGTDEEKELVDKIVGGDEKAVTSLLKSIKGETDEAAKEAAKKEAKESEGYFSKWFNKNSTEAATKIDEKEISDIVDKVAAGEYDNLSGEELRKFSALLAAQNGRKLKNGSKFTAEKAAELTRAVRDGDKELIDELKTFLTKDAPEPTSKTGKARKWISDRNPFFKFDKANASQAGRYNAMVNGGEQYVPRSKNQLMKNAALLGGGVLASDFANEDSNTIENTLPNYLAPLIASFALKKPTSKMAAYAGDVAKNRNFGYNNYSKYLGASSGGAYDLQRAADLINSMNKDNRIQSIGNADNQTSYEKWVNKALNDYQKRVGDYSGFMNYHYGRKGAS